MAFKGYFNFLPLQVDFFFFCIYVQLYLQASPCKQFEHINDKK